jgi:hypothetical protein
MALKPRERGGAVLRVAAAALVLAAFGLADSLGASQQQRAQRPPSGAFSGVVVDIRTGAPIADAVVHLTMTVPEQVGAQDGGSALTDAQGRFVFVELRPLETYRATVSRYGYISYRSPTAIPIAPGAWLADVEVALTPAGQIHGRVWYENGDPMVAGSVRLWQEAWVAGQSRLIDAARTQTDDRGAFVFPDLEPGRYAVCVPSVQATVPVDVLNEAIAEAANLPTREATDPEVRDLSRVAGSPFVEADGVRLLLNAAQPVAAGESRPMTYPPICEPRDAGLAPTGLVALDAGGTRDVELQLSPELGFTVSGVVRGSAETYKGLPLRLYSAESAGSPFGGGRDLATAVVDAAGRFRFMNLPAGRYTIEAIDGITRYFRGSTSSSVYMPDFAPGWAGGSSSGWFDSDGVSFEARRSRRDDEDWGATVVDLERDVADVVLTMAPLGHLSGRLSWPDGIVVPERTVNMFLESTTGDPSLGVPVGRVSRGDVAAGRVDFDVRGIRPGTYLLRPDPPPGWAVRSIRHQGQDWTDRPIAFQGSERIDDVVVELTNELPTLSGRIAAAVEPGARVSVVIFPFDRSIWAAHGRRPPGFLKVSAKLTGRYVMPEFPADRYYVAAVDGDLPPEWQSPEFLERLAAVAVDREIDWGQDVVLDLTAKTVR